MKFSGGDFRSRLPLPATKKWPEGVWYTDAFGHGTMVLLLFAPQGADHQTAHDQDEIYVVVSGNAEVTTADGTESVAQGDAIFIPAGEEHHFEGMSEDFAAWVVFWGPSGGED